MNFRISSKLINGILPLHKLNFDENDLLVPAPKVTGWRAWLSWLRGE